MNYANFEDLALEHEAFLAFLSRHEEKIISAPALTLFGDILEQIHHAKEESFLFPLLFGAKALNIGGPKCTTFFTPRVLEGGGWPDSFHRLKRDLKEYTADPGLSTFRQKAFATKSMITVPLEDHMLGASALKEMLQTHDTARRLELFSKFSAFLRDHIKREEECLFELFRRSLTEEQKQTYAKAAAAFDEKQKTSALLEQLASA